MTAYLVIGAFIAVWVGFIVWQAIRLLRKQIFIVEGSEEQRPTTLPRRPASDVGLNDWEPRYVPPDGQPPDSARSDVPPAVPPQGVVVRAAPGSVARARPEETIHFAPLERRRQQLPVDRSETLANQVEPKAAADLSSATLPGPGPAPTQPHVAQAKAPAEAGLRMRESQATRKPESPKPAPPPAPKSQAPKPAPPTTPRPEAQRPAQPVPARPEARTNASARTTKVAKPGVSREAVPPVPQVSAAPPVQPAPAPAPGKPASQPTAQPSASRPDVSRKPPAESGRKQQGKLVELYFEDGTSAQVPANSDLHRQIVEAADHLLSTRPRAGRLKHKPH